MILYNDDGLDFGVLATRAYLNYNKFESEAMEKGYDLKYRADLTAQSPNVRNMGVEDTTKVYEIVKTYEQALDEKVTIIDNVLDNIEIDTTEIDTLLQNAKDPLNSGLATIEIEHFEIHEGHHFFVSEVQAILANTTINYVLEVGAKPIHFVYSVIGNDAGISGTTYRGVTASSDGTLVAIHNNNEVSANTSTGVLRLNPVSFSTSGATLLRPFRAGTGGTPATRTSGSVNRVSEVILKANTKYSLSVTNLSSSTNNVSIDMSWYEL